MKYKKLIHSELKKIARRVPYNKALIKCANIFQVISFHFTMVPREATNRSIIMEGYKGLNFKVEIFEPSNVKEKLPCLIYVHGGAFSYKASSHHKKLACIYAVKAGCRVCFPDYHLTPKYPYPAAYIETAEYDCLNDEGILYGEKLREAGADVEINETRGTIHGYDFSLNTKIAISNIEKRILFLRKGFHSF